MAQYGPTRLNASGVVSSNSVSNASEILTSNNQYAVLNSGPGDTITIGPFSSAGLQGDEIVSIKLGIEGHSDDGGGLSPSATITYTVGGASGDSESTFEVSNNSSTDEDWPQPLLDITADRQWVFGDLVNLEITLQRESPNTGFRNISADHFFVEVVTQDTPTPEGLNELHEVELGVNPVQLVPNPIFGDLGPVYLVLKCNEDNTDVVKISHVENPSPPTDVVTVEPGQPLLPLNFISTQTDPVEIWAEGATPGQKIQYGIFVDSGVVLQQQANSLLGSILAALLP